MPRLIAVAASLICLSGLGTVPLTYAEGEAVFLPAGATVDALPDASADAIPAEPAATPTSSDSGWVARFSWSPQYCNRNRGSREPQCVPVQGFVLRDLIRVVDGKPLEGCSTGSVTLSPAIVVQMLQFTRNAPETRASWRIYGRCSGLSEVDYAAYTELVDRRIWWPQQYSPNAPDIETSAADLLANVAGANHQLPVEALSTHCWRSYLESIDVRFDDQFRYVASSAPPDGNCKSAIRVRGKR